MEARRQARDKDGDLVLGINQAPPLSSLSLGRRHHSRLEKNVMECVGHR